MMNKRDKQNLKFLMNASPEVLKNWYNETDEDDQMYALELLQQKRLKLAMKQKRAMIFDSHGTIQ